MKAKRIVIILVTVIIITFSAIIVGGMKPDVEGIWNGKKINFIGDSITEQGFFEHREYPKIVKDKLGLSSIENYGIGGSSLCVRNNEYDEMYVPLVNRWEEIEEGDALFILIGTNDYSSQVPFGANDSTYSDEFNGCLNIVLGGLKEKYPNASIIVSTILKRKDNEVPVPVTKYNEIIESKVKEYGLTLFNGYNVQGLDIGNDYEGEITDDRLHPNKNGAKILGTAIADFFSTTDTQ